MANGLRWWVIPGALLVLLGTLLRIGDTRTATATGGKAPSPALAPVAELPDSVEIREASGSRARLNLRAAQSGAFVLDFGEGAAARGVALTIWRRDDAGGRALWSELRPTVRGDGTVPMLGVPAGDYDVEAVLADGTRRNFVGVTAPGVHTAGQPATPSR